MTGQVSMDSNNVPPQRGEAHCPMSWSTAQDAEVDGINSHDIAVCGLSFKFPQDATDTEAFWKMMTERRCAMTDFPDDRVNIKGFHDEKHRINTMPTKGGHFLAGDLAEFDANFFSIAPNEASSMDPMQRWLLEAAYRALENAGISMEIIGGSATGVYCGSFSMDYMLHLIRDAENPPPHAALGFGSSMLANRISWFFNLQGPSMAIDSACSSSAMALDTACVALRRGDCSTALVAGSNLASAPEPYVWMSNVNFLSPDSVCHSFDHRANGYARGEGVAVIVLKRVADALRDGNTLRAIIRSTASNEDGRTPGITQPSRSAQEALIRATYEKAGLSLKYTRFFEAHGTGTPAGDPREAQAIGNAFLHHRSRGDPLYVGAVKSNIGHLEGASGLAGLIKALLALEKGVIPPNTNFEKVNPKIDTDFLNIEFPQTCVPWPSLGLRRASVNSFGYGGSNSHVVLDDAYNYLRLRGLAGRHCTVASPQLPAAESPPTPSRTPPSDKVDVPRILVWSTADENGMRRIVDQYASTDNPVSLIRGCSGDGDALADLAFTLDSHRSHLQWRSFAVLSSVADVRNLSSLASAPVAIHAEPPRIGFVFSGQGAQWRGMGKELVLYDSFREELRCADQYLRGLGCIWSVLDEFMCDGAISDIDAPELSQPLCTILQVAIVNLLERFGIQPSAVVGHSSGEIAAAYAGGYISRESAWRLAYFRGVCSGKLANPPDLTNHGAMMSVGLAEQSFLDLLATMPQSSATHRVSIACINSPNNITLSGPEDCVDLVKAILDEKNVPTRKLRVKVAYHSPQMEAVLPVYMSCVGSLDGPIKSNHDAAIPLVSSLTGRVIYGPDELKKVSYWACNMKCPVQFSQAVSKICLQDPRLVERKIDLSHRFVPAVDHLVEIGPHATLQAPIRDILRAIPRAGKVMYSPTLRRQQKALDTMLGMVGELHCMGLPLKLRLVNEPWDCGSVCRNLLTSLPEYPFDHSQRYWHDSRTSRNYRQRPQLPSEIHGVRSRDWNASDARWTQVIRTADAPWIEDHVVDGLTLYPAAGMLVMAVEAAAELSREAGVAPDGFTFRNVHFEGPIEISSSGSGTEVQVCLRRDGPGSWDGLAYQFHIRTFTGNDWLDNCRGSVTVETSEDLDEWQMSQKASQQRACADAMSHLINACQEDVVTHDMYRFLRDAGYKYGKAFQRSQGQRINRSAGHATAQINLHSSRSSPERVHVIHPASLDAILHLCFTALSHGGQQPINTSVPSRVGCLWLSSQELNSPGTGMVTSFSNVSSTSGRGFTCSGGALSLGDGTEGGLFMLFHDFELTNVTSTTNPLDRAGTTNLCMNVDQKVSVGKLDHTELFHYLESMHRPQEDQGGFYEDLGLLIKESLDRMIACIDPNDFGSGEAWRSRYWHWAQYHLSRGRLQRLPSSPESIGALCERLGSVNRVGRLYVEVALNLVELFQGVVTPLDLLMQTGLLRDYYEELTTLRCMRQTQTLVDLHAHENPGMKILEVGGGTAAATRQLIQALCMHHHSPEMSQCTLRCSEYCFTDVSSAFLEKARDEFLPYKSQMRFELLDIEHDFEEQGFGQGVYDLVVADAVLHITSDLERTFKRVRKCMKPGARLILSEFLKPDGWTLGFVFGLFPGWWVGGEEDRPLSPLMTANEWDTILKSNGFSGAEMVFKDFDGPGHHLGCIVSTAVATETLTSGTNLFPCERGSIIISNEAATDQREFANCLADSLNRFSGTNFLVTDLDTACAPSKDAHAAFCIVLIEYGPPFLGSLDEKSWKRLQALFRENPRILWVSAGGGHLPLPEYGLLDGLARTLRSENYSLHLVTVALDPANDDVEAKVVHLRRIVSDMQRRRQSESYEQEYTETDGRLCTRRLVEASHLKRALAEDTTRHHTVSAAPAQTEIGTTPSRAGIDSVPFYVQALPLSTGTDEDTVQIMVKAVSLAAQHMTSADAAMLGSWSCCAGVVVHALPRFGLTPRQRVFVARSGPLGSALQVSPLEVVPLQDDTTMEEACQRFPPLLTAYQALLEIGKVCASDNVLVYGGCSALGQSALALLKVEGVQNVWTTARERKECDWIAKNIGIPQNRIFPSSRSTSVFLSLPGMRQFDIVLAPYGEAAPGAQLAEAVKPGGRLILLREDSGVLMGGPIQVQHVPPSARVSLVEANCSLATRESLEYVAAFPLLSRLQSDAEKLAQVYPASQIPNTVRSLRDTGEDEINRSDDNNIEATTIRDSTMDPNATYLIAGGLGGLGRSIARWLVARGAQFLILLSRSGPQTPEAHELAREFRETGVRCEMPPCNIADVESLKSALSSCAETMPPIKGCIQAAMVMAEHLTQDLPFSDWSKCIRPKLHGSWNLHSELPSNLDFFILLSSVMGVLGTGSLAAYNAGNTYQDSLARHRIALGQRAISLDLGGIVDEGYLVSNQDYNTGRRRVLQADKYEPIRMRDVLQLLDVLCDTRTSFARDPLQCQAIVGIRPASEWGPLDEIPLVLRQPFWGHMYHIPSLSNPNGQDRASDARPGKDVGNVMSALMGSKSPVEAIEIITEALALRFAALLGISEERLDPHKPMHSYGLDSLSAVEVRNWIGQTFKVEVPVFTILGGATFSSIATTVTNSPELRQTLAQRPEGQ